MRTMMKTDIRALLNTNWTFILKGADQPKHHAGVVGNQQRGNRRDRPPQTSPRTAANGHSKKTVGSDMGAGHDQDATRSTRYFGSNDRKGQRGSTGSTRRSWPYTTRE